VLWEGEVVLIGMHLDHQGLPLVRRTLRCINAPSLLPALPAPPPGLLLRLKVVRPARLIPDVLPYEHEPKAVVAPHRTKAPQGSLAPTSSSPPGAGLPLADIPDPATLLAELLGPSTTAPQSTSSASITPFTRLVGWLAERNSTTARPLLQIPDDPQVCLVALLEQADLIARPLSFDRRDLRRDCGDLIWMGPEGPLLLLSERDGYRLRDPNQPDRPPRRLRRRDLPPDAVLRGLVVIPALQSADTSATGLVRFSFGPASNGASMVVLFTALGLALGFLLAIGREVGAIRWMGGLGALGALLGLGLALLSNSLRPALLTATLSTLLGLLLPTFNTLLTNNALPDRDTTLMLQLGLLLVAAALANVGLQWTQSRTLLGVFLHFASDAQKHFVLKVQPGLIEDGFFARCRNTNYLGEVLIYLSFAMVAMHWLPYVVLAAFGLAVFLPNMRKKDQSLARYPGFEAYRQRSGLLWPKGLI
jgi:protein-S-isoprenylcysteine O-methyltransferase Ste14